MSVLLRYQGTERTGAFVGPDPKLCPVGVRDAAGWWWHQCSRRPGPKLRPVEGSPGPVAVCGQHAAQHDRHEARRAQEAREQAEDDALREATVAQVADLRTQWGIGSAAAESSRFRVTGKVLVDPAELLGVLNALDDMRKGEEV